MFRLSHYMKALASSEAPPQPSAVAAPMVTWNLVRRCSLACAHCHAVAADVDLGGELRTREAFAVVDDLAHAGVREFIVSGGEPMLRPDLFAIAQRARSRGLHVALYTSGALIDAASARRIAPLFDYAEVCLDGEPHTHDRLRNAAGAFERSLAALRLLRDAGAKPGIRYTLMQENSADLASLLALAERESIPRFHLVHLDPFRHGTVSRSQAVPRATTREAMDLLFEAAWAALQPGREREFVTDNDDADSAYLLLWLERRHPQLAARARRMLEAWGGSAPGVAVANIDNLGEVHPDEYWCDYSVGNVRTSPFSQIWQDVSDPVLAELRSTPRPVHERCAACKYLAVCGGKPRARARQLSVDSAADDPVCYLEDAEIGVDTGRARHVVEADARGRTEAAT